MKPTIQPPNTPPQEVDLSQGPASANRSQIGIAEALEPQEIIRLAVENGFNQICQKTGHEFSKEMAAAQLLARTPQSFFDFPIASIFSPDHLSADAEKTFVFFDQKFNSTAQKPETLSKLFAAFEKAGISSSVTQDATMVADEFFTNALFNAPFVDPATNKNPNVVRQNTVVNYDGGKEGHLFAAKDEKRLLIGVRDPYGTLDLKFFLGKIKATFDKGPEQTINFGPGGAGLGSYMIFNVGVSFYFGVLPKHETILCCVIPLGISDRRRAMLPKNLHWIQG